jgi:hypothetical protein
MKTCANCGEEIGDAATCPFCRAAVAIPQVSVLAQVADAEIKLRTLILSFPLYVHTFIEILKSPIGTFGKLDYAAADGLKRAVAFMVQGIAIGYVAFVIGLMLPQSIAGWLTTSPPLLTGSVQQLIDYARRIEDVKGALTPALAREWFKQTELMLAVRVLPEEPFQRMLQRVRELSNRNPDYLERAIKGPSAGERFGGRGYILGFFFALDPLVGGMIEQIEQMTEIGQKYEVKAHIDFLLRATILWLLTCYAVLRFMPSRRDPQKKPGAFIIGAYVMGFLAPLIEGFGALGHTYLAIVLPPYIDKASALLMGQAPAELVQFAGGLFPFENLMLMFAGVAVPAAVLIFALGAFVTGTECVYGISRNRAFAAAGVGLGFGFGMTELVSTMVLAILARTGLV